MFGSDSEQASEASPSPLLSMFSTTVPVPADHLTGIFTCRRIIQNRRDHRSLQPPLASDVSPVPRANDSRRLRPPVSGSVQVRACRVCVFTVPVYIFMLSLDSHSQPSHDQLNIKYY